MPAIQSHRTATSPPDRTTGSAGQAILALDDPRALDADLTGAKAANLARAATRELPVVPGFAITTAVTRGAAVDPAAVGAVRQAWDALSEGGQRVLVVRSSSTVEDLDTTSMAGQFTSVLDVRGWTAFLAAVSAVLRSAQRPKDEVTDARPMAVLVQPQLEPVCGGVLFGLDPVTGDRGRIVVEAVPGTPDVLVSGAASAVHVVLTRRGRIAGAVDPRQAALLGRSRRRRLARLARATSEVFAGPQDVEWAFDEGDRLWLLQSRAITATGSAPAGRGPVLGPGPVAETFPEPLRRLEADLWVEPLREGVIGALRASGAAGRRRIARSPVVTTVGGRVAADLELFGIAPQHGRVLRALSPLRGGRRLVAAWRVGRLRAALPGLAGELVTTVDGELVAVGPLSDLDDRALLELVDRTRSQLVSLHGYEVLAGMLLHGAGDRSSAARLALEALHRCRSDGLADARAIARAPVLLVLVPPRIGASPNLPATAGNGLSGDGGTLDDLGSREALRLRCRWVQELSARAVDELGARLAEAGDLAEPQLVAELGLDELHAAVTDRRLPIDLPFRASVAAGPLLPTAFRVGGESDQPFAVDLTDGADGLPASAGRGSGPACHEVSELPQHGAVLVVDTLDPRLAAVLPRLAGLVSETGSALSHLAILAREEHVPTVVAVPGARERFPVGCRVLVDGGTGEVRPLGSRPDAGGDR